MEKEENAKEYVKCYLVGDDDNQIVAEVDKYWNTHDDYYYKKGKDLVTGTPIILTPIILSCDEDSFSDELTWYGFNRLYRLGAWSNESISKKDALIFLKSMTIEDVKRYFQTIKRAKRKHRQMIKKHAMSALKDKQNWLAKKKENESKNTK